MKRRLLASAWLCLCAGCGDGLKLVVGPTIDTFGRPGVEGRVAGQLEWANLGHAEVLFGLEGGGGVGLLGREQVAVGIAQAGASAGGFVHDDLLLRGSVFYSGRFFSAPMSVGRLDGIGASLGLERLVRDIGENGRLSVGAEADGEYAAGGNVDRGIFLVGFQLQLTSFYVPVL